MGKPSQRDYAAKSRILTNLEEIVIANHVLNVHSRRLQLTLDMLRETANKLLADRGSRHVGLHRPSRFVQHVPRLSLCVNRKYDYQIALNEDSVVIEGRFRLVVNTTAKYSILDKIPTTLTKLASKWASSARIWLSQALRDVRLLRICSQAIQDG